MLDWIRALRHLALLGLISTLGCRPEPSAGSTTTPEPELTADVGGPTASAGTLPGPIYEPSDRSCAKSFAVGTPVEDFELPNVEGDKIISPSNYRERVMVLNFWGTWCKPCLEELPAFDRLYRRYHAHGMTLVAVATDEDPAPVQTFIDKHELRAKVALEGEEAAEAYERPNFPFTFVVDGGGNIVAAFEFVDDRCMGELEQVIRAELVKL